MVSLCVKGFAFRRKDTSFLPKHKEKRLFFLCQSCPLRVPSPLGACWCRPSTTKRTFFSPAAFFLAEKLYLCPQSRKK